MFCDWHHIAGVIPLVELPPRQEEDMVMTFSNRIGGSYNISHQGYVVLFVALFALAWLVSG